VSASFIKREIQKRAITSVNQAILAEKYQAEPKILKNTSNQQKTKFKKKTLQEKLKKSSSSRRKKEKLLNFS
jgi:ribosomal protein L22